MDNYNNNNMYNGNYYNGNIPSGGTPNKTAPNGAMYNETAPNGGMYNGAVPNEGMYNRTIPGKNTMNGTTPSKSMTTPNVNNLPPYDNCVNCKCRGFYYVIKKGDTLYKLSRTFGISVSDLMMANPYINVYNLQVNDEICIPKALEILPNM